MEFSGVGIRTELSGFSGVEFCTSCDDDKTIVDMKEKRSEVGGNMKSLNGEESNGF